MSSDFLQYEITVKEDSSVFKYNNKSETLNTHKHQRYLFQTGSRGGGTTASAFRTQEKLLLAGKKYQALLQYEVDDFKTSKDPDNHYTTLADKYIDQWVSSLARYEKKIGFTSN